MLRVPVLFFTFLRFTGPIHEITADISQSKLILSASPRHYPRRPLCASLLALRLLERYKLSNQKEDINESILYLTESLLSSPLRGLAHGPMIVVDLLVLADSLLMRSRASKEPEDAISAAKYLRHLRDPAHASFAFLRQRVTTTLVVTLALQTELKASDVVQTLEEMAVLTHELLTSDPSGDDTTRAMVVFARALLPDLPDSLPDQVLNQIIECLGLERMQKPEMREVNFALSQCLIIRSDCALNDDFEEAAFILDEMIASSSPGDKFIAPCQALVVRLAMIRSMNSHPENSEEAIYRARAFLTSASSSVEGPLYRTWSRVLENAAEKRFKNFGPVGSLEASSNHSLPSLPLAVLADDSKLTQETHTLDGLLDGIRNNDMTDIDEAIGKGRNILALSDPSDLDAPLVFGEILFEAFERTNRIEYLNELINTDHQLLTCPLPKFQRFPVIARLIGSLLTRSTTSPGKCTQDMHEVVELYPQLLDDGSTLSLRDRFQSACYWALFARDNQHPSVSTAYETALSLMQDTLLFAPTLQLQHDILALGDGYHDMPLSYASYQVDLGQLEQAIETLEKGRALLWSEMRHLRISIDQLLRADSDLGDRFAAVNRDLEELTKSIPPSHKISMDDVIADDLRAGDKFGQLLRKQRGLLKEREGIISQIKALPGFKRFLASPSFDSLRSAASSGPVIIINHSKRSDILILVHNSSPSLIPTPADFYRRANTLKDKLLDSRVKDGLNSSKYDQTLASVLMELYKLIGRPVIERLRQLQVPAQSRIWWCPTSVFCSLPLHAMGPIPSEDGELRYFLDLYISSYTPSLSALIQSRNRDSGSRSSDRPSVLLVAQTDPSLPTVGGEIQVVQALDTEVTSLISETATPAAVLDCFRHKIFVHFACHGKLEVGKPFEAGFELHGHERLTLLEIVRSHVPTAEFAFLSACHTTEVTEGSMMDEGLHLAAAVQYSGFRSVVGTMWAMVDEDGRDLAENFYKALFSNSRREQGIPYHERSAKAPRVAVKKLRRKRRITLERWVNFVHYGA
ncbi:CHAT domain containing protein [Lactarius tabidus]|jgi:CHAT domain-containing protein